MSVAESLSIQPDYELVPRVYRSANADLRPPPVPPPIDAGDLPVVNLGGVPLHAITEAQCVDHIVGQLAAGQGGWVATPNLDHLRRLARDPALLELYRCATLRVADGMPLIWASRLLGTPLPERVAGSSLISSLSAAAAEHRFSVFLLGGSPGMADAAAQALRQRHRNLRIAGTACPPVGFEQDRRALAGLVESLRRAAPDIVYVALGSPKQERLILRLRWLLPRSWWLGVGISFSFLGGRIRRAPAWMQRVGLEWLHRLGQEPLRLGRRYLLDDFPFAASLLGGAAVGGVVRRLDPPGG